MYVRQYDAEGQPVAEGPSAAEVDFVPCQHLLSKGMYVTGELQPRREEHGMGDGYCWCALTQRSTGPDSELAHRRECRPGRACYLPRV